jgi:hypothetical protein
MLPTAGSALADNFHTAGIAGVGATGQPDPMLGGISCSNFTSTPGNATSMAASSGTPFNPANTKTYAGNAGNPNPDKTGNLHPVSQYDVACFQATMHANR